MIICTMVITLAVHMARSARRGPTRSIVHRLQRELSTLSHCKGPSEPALLEQTIGQNFAGIVSRFGDRNAVISRSQRSRLTYEQLNRKSDALASGLRQAGIKKGERVAVSLGNNMEFAVTTYALFKLGAILVPLNPAFTSNQVVSALVHLSVKTLILGAESNLPYKPPRENLSLLKHIVPDHAAGKRVQSVLVPSLDTVVLVDNSSGRLDLGSFSSAIPFHDLWESSGASFDQEDLDPDDIVNIQFTSGTTSGPKAACLTHRGILNNGFHIGSRMGLTEKDVVCCPPPLFHCFGSILGYMATATHGSAILFPSEAFDPKATLLSIQEEHATALYGVATMFVAQLELLANGTVPRTGFDSLRTGIAAGSSVPSSLMQKLHRELGLTGLTIGYGMTETSPLSFMTRPDDAMSKRIDSVGTPMPHVEAKIVDARDRQRTLPLGVKGELAVAGYLVMKGYWGERARSAEVLATDAATGQVWMHTGDEAAMDADGYVRITGRIKDLIIRGGENIHPVEIEDRLFAHPLVSQASVVGLPDERLGECVAAFVTVRAGVRVDDGGAGEGACGPVLTRADVRAWVRARLSRHLVPRYVFWAREYPKTASGKIQKFRLREEGVALAKKGIGLG